MSFPFSIDPYDIVNENKVVRIYSGADSVDANWTELLKDSVPKGYEGILVAIAADNSVDADITLIINGKEQGDLGFPVKVSALPGNLQDAYVMAHIPERNEFIIKGRNLGGSTTLKWRATLVLIKK